MADVTTDTEPIDVNAVPLEAILDNFPEVLSASSLSALRRCHHCGSSADTEGENFRLRRCGGCRTSRYCSKDCQKADWVKHSLNTAQNALSYYGGICVRTRDRDGDRRRAAVARVLLFPRLCGGVLGVFGCPLGHDWALQACAKAFVLQEGGIEWSQNPQKMLWMTLAPASSSGAPARRNSSRILKFKGHEFITLEEKFAEIPETGLKWAEYEPERQAAHRRFSIHPSYVGLLPVMFEVDGVSMTQSLYYPLYRPTRNTTYAQISKHLTLGDILTLCIGSINEGFPLRPIDHASPLLAFPGQYVRHQGTWSWRPFFSDWNCYRRGAFKSLDETLSRMTVGVTVPELMLFFRIL
ncbi:hypothetical protein K466DRAFT_68043 [Polyporus arcularius HHB13444]|uniref:MYND-type domain-containing protein n=1 Tax=Polyporus arcularius HHB13444 TaxID=1314778 RepID=A0A5C3NN03_9APHY|nr:hypothetical protein K466DRAFT_68043 [Polyporus arcularius HHB13444]